VSAKAAPKGYKNMYCPKCGTENTGEVRFCRKCGAELETVAALVEGKLVIADSAEEKGYFQNPSWEKALVPFFFGVAIMIASFILGFDPLTGAPTPWLALLLVAFPILGFGIAQIIKVSNKEKERDSVKVRPATVHDAANRGAKELPESHTEYVSSDDGRERREPEYVPASVVEGTTRHLEMEESVETSDLPQQNGTDE
jgi:hypothetical protein